MEGIHQPTTLLITHRCYELNPEDRSILQEDARSSLLGLTFNETLLSRSPAFITRWPWLADQTRGDG